MSKTYKINWANVAENDLIEIIEYISIDRPADALKILQKIKKMASNLYRLPERGRVVPELQDQAILIYREIVIPPWRIIYRISENDVYVLTVLDARRNVEDILLKRLAYNKQLPKITRGIIKKMNSDVFDPAGRRPSSRIAPQKHTGLGASIWPLHGSATDSAPPRSRGSLL
jgi:toxin ParE1/3/4